MTKQQALANITLSQSLPEFQQMTKDWRKVNGQIIKEEPCTLTALHADLMILYKAMEITLAAANVEIPKDISTMKITKTNCGRK